MRMSFKLHATVVALVIGWSAGQVVLAQSSGQNPAIRREAARPISSIEGKDSFAAYCAACHGKEAKGNGPVAAALKTAPADLTRIAARNGGTFDIIRVERVILGTDKVLPSHGSSDMPIWG